MARTQAWREVLFEGIPRYSAPSLTTLPVQGGGFAGFEPGDELVDRIHDAKL